MEIAADDDDDGARKPLSRIEEDLLFVQILTRLPVKSLIRYQSVCKKWRNLISSPQFAKWHVDCSTSDTFPSLRYCFFVKSPHSLKMLDCARCDGALGGNDAGDTEDGVEGLIELHDLSSEGGFKFVKLIGSCSGLLCFAMHRGTAEYPSKLTRLYVYNPTTHLHFAVSDPLESAAKITACGFGYLSSSDDYVIVIVSEAMGWFCMFSLNSREWTKLRCRTDGISGIGVVVNGKFHWIVVQDSDPRPLVESILVVDLGCESYVEVPVIPKLNERSRLCVMGNRLCVWTADVMAGEMWMLKEYGAWDSWTKLYSLDLMSPELPSPVQYCFGFTEAGKVVLHCSDMLVLVDPYQCPPKHVSLVEGVLDDSGTSYVESLVSPFPAA